MIKLVIEDINDFNYVVSDIDKKYNFMFEFHDVDNNPKVGDYMYVNEGLLREENSFFCFGKLDSKYGHDIEKIDDKELLVLVIDNKKIYLKRLYG